MKYYIAGIEYETEKKYVVVPHYKLLANDVFIKINEDKLETFEKEDIRLIAPSFKGKFVYTKDVDDKLELKCDKKNSNIKISFVDYVSIESFYGRTKFWVAIINGKRFSIEDLLGKEFKEVLLFYIGKSRDSVTIKFK